MRTAIPARPSGRAPFTFAIALSDAVSPDLLTAAERTEYDALRYDVRRRDWLAGRCAAKRAVARRLGVSIDRLSIETNRGAAPACFLLAHGSWVPLPLTLSIAHCAGVAIAAAGEPSADVGVDIEREGAVEPHERAFFLGSREHALARFDPTLTWVLKEATWKALRLDVQTPFTALELDLTDDASFLRGVRICGEWRPARAFVVKLPHALHMCAAIVAVEAA